MGYLLDKQTIQALAAAVALSHDETIRVVQELINLGIIEVVST
jgi:DNA-binding Lrp family transcriptional regulator